MPTAIDRIKKEVEMLTKDELLKLIDELIHHLLKKKNKKVRRFDFNRLYGSGKGIWKGTDAQDYVNQLRKDRF
ncbi:MAG: hypothetical protein ABIL46_08560 [candidate division WOR-3 bacterium]